MTLLRFLFITLAALTFGAATTAQAQDAYRLKAGDMLRIEVVEDPTLNRVVLVAPDGRISLPGAGSVQAGGRTVDQVMSSLATQLGPNFANPPTVFVGLDSLAPRIPATPRQPVPDPVIKVFVLGEAANAGVIELEPGTTLLQAFASFGGFTNFAATRRIQLRRGDTIYEIDYDLIVAGLSPNGNVTMAEGDVIVIPQRRLFE
ncbi:polysaccharide biosynthesis/export family protein [Loktanella sp. DJP18]|uniref:polysaccharide biosynthesis/export family protein n=1 Tax=Loktanella sp. DJP18 TaxID=3409788 RepID=UPI003BB4950F